MMPFRKRTIAGSCTAVAAAALMLSVTTCAPTPTATDAATSTTDPAQARLQNDVNAVRATGVVGVLAEVSTGSPRTFAARAGVAAVGDPAPVPWDAYFRIGSTTKTFVATVVLQLAAEGRLSLDDPVEKWLPGVVDGHGNDGRRITIRQVLQHTSGLHNYLPAPPATAQAWREASLRTWRAEQLIRQAMRHQPEFAPGTSWRYSNTNYVLAGMIIKKVTGHSWQQQVRSRILIPLGLTHTRAVGNDPHLPEPHARAYQRFQPGGPLVDVTVQNQTLGDAAGAMISTTRDLNVFYQALLNGTLMPTEQLTDMRDAIDAKELQAMGTPGARYGLGLAYTSLSCGGGYWGHGGDANGYRTRVGVAEDGSRSVAVSVTSRSPADLKAEQSTNRALLTLVEHALCGTG
ncbi:serine hydrolase domain-containing protein [Nonomuraea rubra]